MLKLFPAARLGILMALAVNSLALSQPITGKVDRVQLLRFTAIQEELGLSNEQIADLLEAAGAESPTNSELIEGMSNSELVEFVKTIQGNAERRHARTDAAIDEILSPRQLARLEQLRIQFVGVRAVFDPPVREKLNLSRDQENEIEFTVQHHLSRARYASKDRPARIRLNVRTGKDVLAVLTPEQRAKLEGMKGKPMAVAFQDMLAEGFIVPPNHLTHSGKPQVASDDGQQNASDGDRQDPPQPEIDEKYRAYAAGRVKKYDSNEDGKMSVAEAQAGKPSLVQADDDGDGFLTVPEIALYYQKLYKR